MAEIDQLFLEFAFAHTLSMFVGVPPEGPYGMERLQEEPYGMVRLPEELEYKTDKETNRKFCSLCQEAIANSSIVMELPCGHIFHANESADCVGLRRWVLENTTCPNCKRNVNQQQPQ